MTEHRKLLANDVTKGSEPAFRELVSRCLNLLASKELRLVDGDAHRTADVTQTVFVAFPAVLKSSRGVHPNAQ